MEASDRIYFRISDSVEIHCRVRWCWKAADLRSLEFQHRIPKRNLCHVFCFPIRIEPRVVATTTICRGNRRPVPSILANNLLSFAARPCCPFLSRIAKKKKVTTSKHAFYNTRIYFRHFSFSSLPFRNYALLQIVDAFLLSLTIIVLRY